MLLLSLKSTPDFCLSTWYQSSIQTHLISCLINVFLRRFATLGIYSSPYSVTFSLKDNFHTNPPPPYPIFIPGLTQRTHTNTIPSEHLDFSSYFISLLDDKSVGAVEHQSAAIRQVR